VVVDTHPGETLLTDAALAAANLVVVPVVLRTRELAALGDKLAERAGHPLLLAPNLVPSPPAPPACRAAGRPGRLAAGGEPVRGAPLASPSPAPDAPRPRACSRSPGPGRGRAVSSCGRERPRMSDGLSEMRAAIEQRQRRVSPPRHAPPAQRPPAPDGPADSEGPRPHEPSPGQAARRRRRAPGSQAPPSTPQATVQLNRRVRPELARGLGPACMHCMRRRCGGRARSRWSSCS
jgi:hypothetical protein